MVMRGLNNLDRRGTEVHPPPVRERRLEDLAIRADGTLERLRDQVATMDYNRDHLHEP